MGKLEEISNLLNIDSREVSPGSTEFDRFSVVSVVMDEPDPDWYGTLLVVSKESGPGWFDMCCVTMDRSDMGNERAVLGGREGE